MRRGIAIAFGVAAWVGCATAPPAPVASRDDAPGVWGYVRLVPREGVEVSTASRSYGDRRLADVTLVDYSRPGFVVVWAEGTASPGGRAVLSIESSATGLHIAPAHAAVGVGGEIALENRSAQPHVVSLPSGNAVRRLAPGESAVVPVTTAGEWPVFLLDGPRTSALVFAAPGRFAVASPAGRYELEGLAPGTLALHAWHPRFPPATARVEVAGPETRVDFDLRVDQPGPEGTHAR